MKEWWEREREREREREFMSFTYSFSIIKWQIADWLAGAVWKLMFDWTNAVLSYVIICNMHFFKAASETNATVTHLGKIMHIKMTNSVFAIHIKIFCVHLCCFGQKFESVT